MTIYRVDTYAGTPAWTDITPGSSYEPAYPYALHVDPTNTAAVIIAGDDGVNQHWLTSDDQGATWTDGGATSATMRVAKHAGVVILQAGADALQYSENYGDSYASKLGDWSSGTIRGLWVVL